VAKLLTGGAAMLGLAGCSEHSIHVYTVPKETNTFAAASPFRSDAMAGGMGGDAASQPRPTLKWSQLPEGWKEGAGSSMRVASFTIESADGKKAEVGVIPLPGVTGVENQSLNMWRGELELAPAAEPELAASGKPVQIGDSVGKIYDFASETAEKGRIVGAVLQRPGSIWFFKMKGAAEIVAAQKTAFTNFLSGVTFGEGTPATGAVAESSAEAESDAPGLPAWEVPAHWQKQGPKNMVLATFAVTEGAGRAEIAISSFPGNVGGLTANVNRWRRQLGLTELAESEVGSVTSPLQVNGENATVVDLKNDKGPNGAQSTVAVIVPHAGSSWFFKITGPDAVVNKEKPAFIKFVQSVRFPKNA
jgi:hypothetical protein